MRMNIYMTSLVVLIGLLLCTTPIFVSAESLWAPEKTKTGYEDKKASKVGDVVTVLIVETASSSQSASTDAKKSSSFDSPVGLGPLLKQLPALQFTNGDTLKGSGNTNRTSTLSASMTVKVVSLDEAGNLKIEGSREVQTNGEKATIRLSGTIRPQDVSQENTVMSTYVADAKIQYDGKGTIGSRQKEGIIQRLFKLFF